MAENLEAMLTMIGEGVPFDRVRRQNSDVGFEEVRSEYSPYEENITSNPE